MQRNFFIIGIIVSMALAWSASSEAQLLIEQGKLSLIASPGKTIVDTLKVHNTSSQRTVRVRAYWEDFEYVAPFNAKKKFSTPGTSAYSMHDWIRFSPAEFTMAPQDQRSINYTIRVPKDIDQGHYGVLFFEEMVDDPQAKVGIRIVSRVGALFFLEPSHKDVRVSIEQPTVEGHFLKMSFMNQGNVFLIPKTIYYVLTTDGRVARRGDVEKFYLPPGETFEVILPLFEKLEAGSYDSVITFDLEGGDSVVKEIDFSINQTGQVTLHQSRD